MRSTHAVTGGRFPPELAADGLTFVPHPAREDIGVVAETAEDLRELRRMSERVGDVRDTRRPPELAGAPEPLLQIADDRFAGHEKQIREDVPGTDEESVGSDECFDSRQVRGALLEVILDRDGLAVEGERTEVGIAVENVEEVRNHREK